MRISPWEQINDYLDNSFPLASKEIQQSFEPGWETEDSGHWNNLYLIPGDRVAFVAEDGPDNGDGLGRSGLFVFPVSCFVQGKGAAKFNNGYFISISPGWKLRLSKLIEGRILNGVESVEC